MVHGDEVGSKLARKVVLLFKALPVNVRVRVLGLLQCMSNSTLEQINSGQDTLID